MKKYLFLLVGLLALVSVVDAEATGPQKLGRGRMGQPLISVVHPNISNNQPQQQNCQPGECRFEGNKCTSIETAKIACANEGKLFVQKGSHCECGASVASTCNILQHVENGECVSNCNNVQCEPGFTKQPTATGCCCK